MSGIISGEQELKGNISEQQSLQGNVPLTIGVSPTINVIPMGNSHLVVINDINGMKTFTVKDGQDYVLTDKDKEDIASIFEYTKANAIKSNASGETILLTDSAEAPLQVQKVFGKSEQVSIAGNQLLSSYVAGLKQNGVITNSGITVTLAEDGNLELSGTCTVASINITVFSGVVLTAGETYTLSGLPSQIFYIWDNVGSTTLATKSAGANSVTFTAKNTGKHDFSFNTKEGTTYASGTLLNMMLAKGTTAKNWQPYVGGIASPNPNYPQEIKSCGDSGSIVQKVLNGNLLDHSSQLYAGSDGSVTYLASMVSSVVDVRGIDSVYLSGDFTVLDYGVTRIGLYDEKPLNLAQGLIGTRITTSASGVIDVSNCNYLLVGLLPASGLNSDAVKNSFMLNVGTTPFPFEHYKEQLCILQTPNGLRGLKVANESEANYKDADGNLWACDYVDFERGKFVQRIVEGLIDGTVYGYVGGGVIQYSKKTVFGCEVLSTSAYEKDLKTYVLCDRWLTQSSSYNHSVVSGRMYFSKAGDDIITVENSILETQDSAGRIKFFTEHPTKIYAIRKEPIETDLTEEQIAQYKALMTNYPNTTIINDANAYTEVKYSSDTKLYIDNKFKEMTSAIAQLL